MKTSVLIILLLVCTAAGGHVYQCPAENAGAALTNAEIRVGIQGAAHALHGDVDQVAGGTNIYFHLPGDDPRWLVCQYGGQRVEGTAISGPGAIGGHEAWIQLDPLTAACDLTIRETKKRGEGRSTWSAAATCKKREPPPPDLV